MLLPEMNNRMEARIAEGASSVPTFNNKSTNRSIRRKSRMRPSKTVRRKKRRRRSRSHFQSRSLHRSRHHYYDSSRVTSRRFRRRSLPSSYSSSGGGGENSSLYSNYSVRDHQHQIYHHYHEEEEEEGADHDYLSSLSPLGPKRNTRRQKQKKIRDDHDHPPVPYPHYSFNDTHSLRHLHPYYPSIHNNISSNTQHRSGNPFYEDHSIHKTFPTKRAKKRRRNRSKSRRRRVRSESYDTRRYCSSRKRIRSKNSRRKRNVHRSYSPSFSIYSAYAASLEGVPRKRRHETDLSPYNTQDHHHHHHGQQRKHEDGLIPYNMQNHHRRQSKKKRGKRKRRHAADLSPDNIHKHNHYHRRGYGIVSYDEETSDDSHHRLHHRYKLHRSKSYLSTTGSHLELKDGGRKHHRNDCESLSTTTAKKKRPSQSYDRHNNSEKHYRWHNRRRGDSKDYHYNDDDHNQRRQRKQRREPDLRENSIDTMNSIGTNTTVSMIRLHHHKRVPNYTTSTKTRKDNGGDKKKYSDKTNTNDKKRRSESSVYDDSYGHFEGEFGTVIGNRYKLLEDVGMGTFGRVVKAIDLRGKSRRKISSCSKNTVAAASTSSSSVDNDVEVGVVMEENNYIETVAIKIVRKVKRYYDSALIEAEILQDVNKRGGRGNSLCAVMLDSFNLQGHYCLVFECLGRSLYDFMKEHKYRPFPLYCVRDFARQLLDALDFLHGFGLIHTDLKPENILLTDNRERTYFSSSSGGRMSQQQVPYSTTIKVIDFGGATYDFEKKSNVVNTRQYRAPEVILGMGWSTPSDLWSLGCILSELYVGELLFATHDNVEHLALMERIVGRFPAEMIWGDVSVNVVSSSFSSTRSGKNKQPSCQFATAFDTHGWHRMGGVLPPSSLEHVVTRSSLETLISHEDRSSGFSLLLRSLLVINPRMRKTAGEGLKLQFFR